MKNSAILIGNLGKDPEIKTTEKTTICTFSLATSEKWDGEVKTTWHNIVFFGKIAEICGQYLKKGSLVCIEGKINNRSYDNKDGVKVYVSEIVGKEMTMLGGKEKTDAEKATPAYQQEPKQEESDDLPF